MLAYHNRQWRCFFTTKTALLYLVLLNIIGVFVWRCQKVSLLHHQSQLNDAQKRLNAIQVHLSSFKIQEDPKFDFAQCLASTSALENNLTCYLDPYLVSKTAIEFLNNIHQNPEKYGRLGGILSFLLKNLPSPAWVESIDILKDYDDGGLMGFIKGLLNAENVENGFLKIKFQTTYKIFNDLLTRIASTNFSFWIQDIDIEVNSIESGILPTFTFVISYVHTM